MAELATYQRGRKSPRQVPDAETFVNTGKGQTEKREPYTEKAGADTEPKPFGRGLP